MWRDTKTTNTSCVYRKEECGILEKINNGYEPKTYKQTKEESEVIYSQTLWEMDELCIIWRIKKKNNTQPNPNATYYHIPTDEFVGRKKWYYWKIIARLSFLYTKNNDR